MTRFHRQKTFGHGFWIIVLGAVLAGLGACREEPSPQLYERDLGEGEAILLPVDSPMMDAKIARGTAEFPELRDPAEEVVDLGPEGQVNDLINEFNELVRNKDYDSLADELAAYFVERQQDDIAALIEMQITLIEKNQELIDALTEAAPDQADRIGDATDEALTRDTFVIEVESLRAISETELAGRRPADEVLPLPGFDPNFHFELVDDEWYIVEPNLELIKAAMPQLSQVAIGLFDAWIQGLKTGSVTADQVLTTLEMQMAAGKDGAAVGDSAETEDGGANEPDDTDAEENTEDEDDADAEDEPEPEEEATPTPPTQPGG